MDPSALALPCKCQANGPSAPMDPTDLAAISVAIGTTKNPMRHADLDRTVMEVGREDLKVAVRGTETEDLREAASGIVTATVKEIVIAVHIRAKRHLFVANAANVANIAVTVASVVNIVVTVGN